MKVKVFATCCKTCGQNMLEAVKEALELKGLSADVEYIDDLEKIAEYGVMRTPALMVDDKLVSAGRSLSAQEILPILV